MRKLSNLILLFLSIVSLGQSESLLQKATRNSKPAVNPFQNNFEAQKAGQKLFQRECSGCHGQDGQGKRSGHTPTLTNNLVRQAHPGALFWILKNGSASHRMPSFSHLPEEQRWQIIVFLQSVSVAEKAR